MFFVPKPNQRSHTIKQNYFLTVICSGFGKGHIALLFWKADARTHLSGLVPIRHIQGIENTSLYAILGVIGNRSILSFWYEEAFLEWMQR